MTFIARSRSTDRWSNLTSSAPDRSPECDGERLNWLLKGSVLYIRADSTELWEAGWMRERWKRPRPKYDNILKTWRSADWTWMQPQMQKQIHPQKLDLCPLPQQVVAMFSNIFEICPCDCHSDELLNILRIASWATDLINIMSTKARYSFFFPLSSVNYFGRINRAFIIIVISCLPVSKTSLINCTSCQLWQETLNPQTRGTRGRLSADASASLH